MRPYVPQRGCHGRKNAIAEETGHALVEAACLSVDYEALLEEACVVAQCSAVFVVLCCILLVTAALRNIANLVLQKVCWLRKGLG